MGSDSRSTVRDAGFTLVELLIVIVVLGVLSSVAVFSVRGITSSGEGAACETELMTLATAIQVWRSANPSAVTVTEADLVQSGLARSPSANYDVVDLQTIVAAPGGGCPAVPVGATTLPTTTTVAPTTTAAPTTTKATTTTVGPTTTKVTTTTVAPTTTAAPTTTKATTTTMAPTTTVAPTTTTLASNGVTVTDSVSGDHTWYGENRLQLSNTSTITALSVTITVAKTTGLSYNGQYTTFWGDTIQSGNATSSGAVTFQFDLVQSKTIVAGSWTLVAQTNGTGTVHPTTGDRWTVTSTSGGMTRTLTGWF